MRFWADKCFGRRPWTFQQESTSLYSARVNQEWIKDSIEALGRQTFRHRPRKFQQDRTQRASTKNGLKRRFLTSFLSHNGHQNLRILMSWTLEPGAFWRVRISLKIPKYRSFKDGALPGMGANTEKPLSCSLCWLCRPFEGHNSYQMWPIRIKLK